MRCAFPAASCTWLFLIGVAGPAGAEGAEVSSVSPGSPVDAVELSTSCPAFSWSGSERANGYELVLYRVDDQGALERVMSKRISGGRAASWTPPSASCPQPGADYAWAVRALTEEGAGPWSEPLLFSTAGTPSEDEVRLALETLRRYRNASLGSNSQQPTTNNPFGRVGIVGKGPRHPDPTTRRGDDLAPSHVPDGGLSGTEARRYRADGGRTLDPPLRTSTMSGASSPQTVTTPPSFSLNLSGNIDLGGIVFQDGTPLLHTDGGATHYNTALGLNALVSATPGMPSSYSGSGNSAFGSDALRNNTTGFSNSAFGSGALLSNTEGFDNTASGSRALVNNTTGSRNTASGELALFSNTTGSSNTASGASALFSNTTGSYNTASGGLALVYNTTGQRNTASGFEALLWNSTGIRNSAIGFKAMHENTIGNDNTAMGDRAMYHNTEGYLNVANGYTTMFHNTSGHRNTATGHRALFTNTSGFRNAAMGDKALYANSTGAYNTAVGPSAGSSWTNGDDNVAIGWGAFGVAGESSTIRIGGDDFQTKTYIEGISATNVTGVNVLITSDDQLGVAASSGRFKQDIHDLEGISERLQELRPVTFRYKEEFASGESNPLEYGLIAEEVAKVFPELVAYDEAGQPYTVRYHLLTPLLLAELQRQEEELARLRKLEPAVADLNRRLARVSRTVKEAASEPSRRLGCRK